MKRAPAKSIRMVGRRIMSPWVTLVSLPSLVGLMLLSALRPIVSSFPTALLDFALLLSLCVALPGLYYWLSTPDGHCALEREHLAEQEFAYQMRRWGRSARQVAWPRLEPAAGRYWLGSSWVSVTLIWAASIYLDPPRLSRPVLIACCLMGGLAIIHLIWAAADWHRLHIQEMLDRRDSTSE